MAKPKKSVSSPKKSKTQRSYLAWVPDLPLTKKAATVIIFVLIFANIGTLAVLISGASSLPGMYGSIEKDQVNRINSARKAVGKGSYQHIECLNSVAESWAYKMATSGNLAHNPNLGSNVTSKCGGSWKFVGENVGYGGSSSQLFTAFMNSAPHKANILDNDYRKVGVGAYIAPNGTLWVAQVFGACSSCTTNWSKTATVAVDPVASDPYNSSLSNKLVDANLSAGWTEIATGDFGGDTGDEVVFYRKSDGRYVIYNGSPSGSGLSTKYVDTNISATWDIITAADLDGNGNDELIFYRKSDGKYMVYQGSLSGSGLGAKILDTNISVTWDSITAGDFDNNGNDELVFYRKSDGLFLTYEGALTGLGSKIGESTASTGWSSIATGDFGGDTGDEIVFYNKSSGRYVVYEGGRTGWGTKKNEITISTNWDQVDALDVDNNSNDEPMFYRSTDGRFLIYDSIVAN